MNNTVQRINLASYGILLAAILLPLLFALPVPANASKPSTLESMMVSPATDLIVASGTQQFSVTGLNQYGNSVAPTNVSWSVSGGGTINSSGLLTAGSTTGGPFTVTATSANITAQATFNIVSTRSVTFGAPITIPVTGQNGSLVADVDGDGHQDVVVRTSTSLVFLFGNGDFTFTQVTYPYTINGIGGGWVGMEVGDLYGNGLNDIVCTAGNQIAVIANLGNRTFAAPVYYTACPGSDAIALGDFNEDGHLDIAVVGDGAIAGQGPNDLAVLLNDGAGGFGAPTIYSVPGNYYGYTAGVATLDVNSDGHLDLICSEEDELASAVSSVYLGNGRGAFSLSTQSPITVAGGEIFTTDLNNDGIPDIVASDHWAQVPRWGLGNGQGGFTSQSAPGNGWAGPIVSADFAGTGYQDLAQAYSSTDDVLIYSNNGDGSFAPGVGYAFIAQNPTVGDFNEDGQPDIALYLATNEVVIYPNETNPAPTITELSPNSANVGSPVSLTVYGHGLLSRSVINWNGTPVPTTFNYQSGTLTASISSTLLAQTGTTNVTVTSASPGGGTSNSLPFAVGGLASTPTFIPAGGTYLAPQLVSIADSQNNVTIYYTTDGTAPTTNSSVYETPISVLANETIKAIAVVSGYTNSPVATAIYVIAPVLPTPTISPASNTYSTTQSVTITDTQSGVTIYYTTDGTTPNISSHIYSSAIAVASSETIKAIAVESGYTNSSAATAVYTIAPIIPAPTFSPISATYPTAQSVVISDSQSGVAIYYTTDGTTPTIGSSLYSSAIPVTASETIKAIAVEAGYTNSSVGTAVYTIAPVIPTPTFTPGASTYTTPQSVSISVNQGGVTIYYTTDGSTPTTNSTVYSTPITVSSAQLIKAIASESGYTNSGVGSAYYTIAPIIPAPTFGVAAGTYSAAQSVSINDSQSGVTIFYTTNGTTPTTNSPRYSSPLQISSTETVTAIAIESGYTNSSVGSAAYAIVPAVPTPSFSPGPATYTNTQMVTISDTQSGATIYYTTDGTTPTINSNVYSSAISVSASETIEAIAEATNYSNSNVASSVYVIAPLIPAPTFSPVAGTYVGSQSVSLVDTQSGVTIYFTTDGSTPTTSSSVYSSPIAISATETINAFAAEAGYTSSPVNSALFTIQGTLPTPIISPNGGTITIGQSVTLSDSQNGSSVYYTTNGTTPSSSSALYTGPITISASETIEAIAVAAGNANSAIATASFTASPHTWTAVSVSLGPDGNTHLLWDRTDGSAAFWTMGANGNIIINNAYGPFPGWTAKSVVTDSSNNTYALWDNANGSVTVWKENGSGSFTGLNTFGPFPGWTAKTMSVGGDGLLRLLWTNTDGSITNWVGNGMTFTGQSIFGPFSGWSAQSIATDSGNQTHLLWTNTNDSITNWAGNGMTFTGQPVFGPISGWSAIANAAAPDKSIRVLWDNSNGQMTTWAGDGNTFTGEPTFGPFSGWTATALAVGGDSQTRVLWDNANGSATIWTLRGSSYTSTPTFGPF